MGPASQPAGILDAIHTRLKRNEPESGDACRSTGPGLWASSGLEQVHQAFRQIRLNNYNHLADLGSGDGRVVLIASLFTRATGIEYDPELCRFADDAARDLGLEQARFIRGDYKKADLSPYDILFFYPDKPLDWLAETLPPDWKGHALVYGPNFPPPGFSLQRQFTALDTTCRLWRRP